MKFPDFFKRIEPLMAERKLSPRKTSMRAGLNPDFLRDLSRRGHAPKFSNIAAIARVLDVPTGYLWEAVQNEAPQPMLQPQLMMKTVYVKGEVQAGVWREALEWNPADWFALTVPVDGDFVGVERFGLAVRGSSMDKIYPDGTFVVVVRFSDIMRGPRTGERVVVLRRQRGGTEYEATLKEYERDAKGRHLLWPRSSDPEFQQPFILTSGEVPLGAGGENLPGQVHAGAMPEDTDEIVVSALVTGSWRPERTG